MSRVALGKPRLFSHHALLVDGSAGRTRMSAPDTRRPRIRQLATAGPPGRRRESHPPPPTDPYVTVFRYTARAVLIVRRAWSMPGGGRFLGAGRRCAAR